jgi:cell division protein FtsB
VYTDLWDKLSRVVVFLLFLAGVLAVGLWYRPLIDQNERFRKEVHRLHAAIQKEEERGRQMKSSIDALRLDPRAIEREARLLGFAKPGEKVVRFLPSPSAPGLTSGTAGSNKAH